jgi:predicted DNA-binding transcriptional regulator AlpA
MAKKSAPPQVVAVKKSPAPPQVVAVDPRKPHTVLLAKREVLRRIGGISFPTIWLWMQKGKFPRSRIVGGKTMWLEADIEKWIEALPETPLKAEGSAAPEAAE